MKRAALLAATLTLFLLAFPLLAQAQEGTIVIDIAGVVEGEEGEIVEVARQDVPPELVGATCDGFVTIENNASTHRNNDLIIETGDVSAEILDVENEAGVVIELEGTITVGEEVVLSIRFGPDGITSGGATLTLECVQQTSTTTTTTSQETTTTSEASTTTSEATTTTTSQATTTTTSQAATTTAPPPVGGVQTGAGGASDATQSPLPFLGATLLLAVLAVGLWSWWERSER